MGQGVLQSALLEDAQRPGCPALYPDPYFRCLLSQQVILPLLASTPLCQCVYASSLSLVMRLIFTLQQTLKLSFEHGRSRSRPASFLHSIFSITGEQNFCILIGGTVYREFYVLLSGRKGSVSGWLSQGKCPCWLLQSLQRVILTPQWDMKG